MPFSGCARVATNTSSRPVTFRTYAISFPSNDTEASLASSMIRVGVAPAPRPVRRRSAPGKRRARLSSSVERRGTHHPIAALTSSSFDESNVVSIGRPVSPAAAFIVPLLDRVPGVQPQCVSGLAAPGCNYLVRFRDSDGDLNSRCGLPNDPRLFPARFHPDQVPVDPMHAQGSQHPSRSGGSRCVLPHEPSRDGLGRETRVYRKRPEALRRIPCARIRRLSPRALAIARRWRS